MYRGTHERSGLILPLMLRIESEDCTLLYEVEKSFLFSKAILLKLIRYNTNKINISNDTKQEKDTYPARL